MSSPKSPGREATANDVPGGLVGESPCEGIADLIRSRMRCVHPNNQQDDSNCDKQHHSEKCVACLPIKFSNQKESFERECRLRFHPCERMTVTNSCRLHTDR